MKQFLSTHSFHAQMTCVAIFCALLMSTGAVLVSPPGSVTRFRVFVILGISGLLCVGLTMVAVRVFIHGLLNLGEGMRLVINGQLEKVLPDSMPNREMRHLKATFDEMVDRLRESQADLAEQTRTLHRLLDFSQTIQNAACDEQIFHSLIHYLRTELGLEQVVVSSSLADPHPPTVLAAYPESVKSSPVHEFAPPGGFSLPLDAGEAHLAVHMLVPEGQNWTGAQKQLAQTYVNTARSVLTSLQLLAEAERQSMTDPLTGLYNRRSLDRLLEREVLLAGRHGTPLSLVMIDLDHFKQINDTLGHAAGDHLLKALADCCRATLRKSDLPFRYGGDEFIVALPQTTLPQAEQVVQKLRQAFATINLFAAIPNLKTPPTLSIGVAELSDCANSSLESLLSAADHAVYQAKRAGRNCIYLSSPIRAA